MFDHLAPGDVVTGTRIDNRLVPVSAHGSASERNCALASTIWIYREKVTGARSDRRELLKGAQPYPRPHRRRRQPGTDARAAHGPTLETHRRTRGGSTAAADRRSHSRRTRAQLRRRQEHEFAALTTKPRYRGKHDSAALAVENSKLVGENVSEMGDSSGHSSPAHLLAALNTPI